jgi:hypothetical protein
MIVNLTIRIMPHKEYRLIYSKVKQIEVKNKTELKSEIKAIRERYQTEYKNDRVYVDSEIILN